MKPGLTGHTGPRRPRSSPGQPGALTRSRGASDVDLKAVLTEIANALELLDQSGIERTW